MKMRLMLLTALLTLYCTPAFIPPVAAGNDLSNNEIKKDVEKILDLWRDEQYAELYTRVTNNAHTKEYLISHLSAAPRKPSCCWDKLQEFRVSQITQQRATIHAKFGFDSSSGVEFMTNYNRRVQIKMKSADCLVVLLNQGIPGIVNRKREEITVRVVDCVSGKSLQREFLPCIFDTMLDRSQQFGIDCFLWTCISTLRHVPTESGGRLLRGVLDAIINSNDLLELEKGRLVIGMAGFVMQAKKVQLQGFS